MEERQRYSLQKGFEWRTMRGIIWRMTFEDLSSSHDPRLVYSVSTWSLVDSSSLDFRRGEAKREEEQMCLTLVACSGNRYW